MLSAVIRREIAAGNKHLPRAQTPARCLIHSGPDSRMRMPSIPRMQSAELFSRSVSTTRRLLCSSKQPLVTPAPLSRSVGNATLTLARTIPRHRAVWQGQHTAHFHTSRPNQVPLPVLPVALFTLKTPVTALVLRMISRVSLTLLPLSAKQSPKVILTLVSIPPVCFGLVIFAGLEAAPNTGRWRFLFTSEEEEMAMLEEEIPMFMESIKVVEDENDPRVRLVRHILKNLLSTSIEQDGSTLRTGIVEKLEKRHQEAQLKLKEKLHQQQLQDTPALTATTAATPAATKAIVSTQKPVPPPTSTVEEDDEDDPDLKAMTFEERPFQIFVAEDDSINAFSLGPPRLIYINSGLMEWLDNDEDLVAAVVAHELAHVIQRHTMETHGRETVMLFLAGPLHQTIEVEADTVSLTLMALAGYDPMHAVRLWEQWADKDQKEMDAEDSADVHKWTDWMYDHPPSAERARYLKEAVMPAREMWEKVLQRRREPMKRYVSLDMRLRAQTDEDGDLTEGTVEDVMETMDEILKRQEEEEKEARRQRGVMGTLRRWGRWRPWASTEIDANMGTTEPVTA
ncbi:hypothetical protein BGZ72_008645 [Mortierella alpina]|nr:hypothetical protein BGZ72_008645 [Mortierella alpina]